MSNCVFIKQEIEYQLEGKDFAVFIEPNGESHIPICIAATILFPYEGVVRQGIQHEKITEAPFGSSFKTGFSR